MARTAPRLRNLLLIGSALGGLTMAAAPAWALPGAPINVAVNTGGTAPGLPAAVGNTLNINLNAPRTVLQYGNGFAIGTGETVNFNFNARSDIAVVHALSGTIQIDGTLHSFVGQNYGGNVWLLSAAGVFFGGGAQVDVGGLLASTSIPNKLLDPAGAVLTPGTLSFDFGSGDKSVAVGANARLTGHGGSIALIAPSVVTGRGARIGGAGDTSVLYGAAQSYTVRFSRETGDDLDLLDFEVPGLTAGTAAALPLQLAGTTSAGNVYVASVGRADAVRAVITTSGEIGAVTAGLEGGTVVLTAGGGIAGRAAAPLSTGGAFAQAIQGTGTITADRGITATATGDIALASLSTAGSASVAALSGDAGVDRAATGLDLGITAVGGLARLGDGAVGRDFLLSGRQVSLGSLGPYSPSGGSGLRLSAAPASTPTRDIVILASAGDFEFDAPLAATRDVRIDVSGDLLLGTVSAGRDGSLAGGSLFADALTAGRDATATARLTDLYVGALRAGDDAVVTGAAGGLVDLYSIDATGLGPDSEGDGSNIRISGNSVSFVTGHAATDLVISATDSAVFGEGPGAIATAGRDLLVTAAGIDFDRLTAGRDISLTATAGGIAPTTLGGASTLTAGRDIILDSSDPLQIGTLTAVRDLVLTGADVSADVLSAGRDVSVTARSGDVGLGQVRAGDDVIVAGSPLGLVDIASAITDATGADSEGDGSTVKVSGNSVSIESADAATDLLVTAGDTALLGESENGSAKAGRDIVVTAAAIDFLALNAGRDIVLTATGGGIAQGSLGTSAATLIAGRDVILTADDVLAAGSLSAVRDLVLTGTSVVVDSAAGGRDLTVTATGTTPGAGQVTIDTALAGDDIRLTGPVVGVTRAQTGGGGGDSEGDGANIVLAGGQITAGQLAAATDIVATGTGAVSIAQAIADRDVIVSGATVGGALQLSGRDVSVTSGGAFAATAGLNAARDLRLTAGTTLSFTQLTAARDLFLTAATVAGGSAAATRDLTVTATTAITGTLYQAGRTLVLDPGEAINVTTARAGGDATLIGASVGVGTLDVGGTTLVQATAGGIALDTFTGHATTLLATGKVDLGSSTSDDIRIVGADLDVRRGLTASNLQVETPGRMILGGTAAQGETGFRLAAADLARLQVSGIAGFYAGVTTDTLPTLAAGEGNGQVAGGDLIVQDFSYDPANLPRLALFADRAHVVDVVGHLTPTVSGGAIQIGDANVNGRFRPLAVDVEGGIGSAELVTNCFGRVVAVNSLSIYAVGDIVFGTGDFRAAVGRTTFAALDVNAGTPGSPAPHDDRLFAVATRLTVDAGGAVVSQNTASNQGSYVGVLIGGLGVATPLVNVGRSGAIDLSGSVIDPGGTVLSGPTVALASGLGSTPAGAAIFRFNGCIVGAGICGGATDAEPGAALRVEEYSPPRPIDLADAPLTTVLVVEQNQNNLDVLTVGTDADAIVIRKRPGQP